ncbi:hypothetical protein T4E_4913, partial [Trichinella pseudospiralis]
LLKERAVAKKIFFEEANCNMNNTDRGSLSYECIKARHERGDTSIDGIIEELEFLLKDGETVKKQISESLGAPKEVLEIYGLALPEETAENVEDDENLIQQLCLPGTSEQFITQEGVVRRKRKMRKKSIFKAVNPVKRKPSKKVKVRRRKALDIADLTPQQKAPYEKPFQYGKNKKNYFYLMMLTLNFFLRMEKGISSTRFAIQINQC